MLPNRLAEIVTFTSIMKFQHGIRLFMTGVRSNRVSPVLWRSNVSVDVVVLYHGHQFCAVAAHWVIATVVLNSHGHCLSTFSVSLCWQGENTAQ